jgi:hypothetical protein
MVKLLFLPKTMTESNYRIFHVLFISYDDAPRFFGYADHVISYQRKASIEKEIPPKLGEISYFLSEVCSLTKFHRDLSP